MSWNYRILLHRDGTLALHEVYYDENGQPRSYAAPPASFVVDSEEGAEGVVLSLERALRDARERPVLDAAAMVEGRVPNAETVAAMEESDRGQGVSFASVEDLMRELNED